MSSDEVMQRLTALMAKGTLTAADVAGLEEAVASLPAEERAMFSEILVSARALIDGGPALDFDPAAMSAEAARLDAELVAAEAELRAAEAELAQHNANLTPHDLVMGAVDTEQRRLELRVDEAKQKTAAPSSALEAELRSMITTAEKAGVDTATVLRMVKVRLGM